jgi:hypothetical protein
MKEYVSAYKECAILWGKSPGSNDWRMEHGATQWEVDTVCHIHLTVGKQNVLIIASAAKDILWTQPFCCHNNSEDGDCSVSRNTGGDQYTTQLHPGS